MSERSNRPIIIKRKKVIAGGGHHGGAWKVAYADFVTAMMAFFMLMWLLNATTESQRKGLADYFSPTIPITRTSGGGSGAFGGENAFSDEMSARNVNQANASQLVEGLQVLTNTGIDSADTSEEQENQRLEALQEALLGSGGESFIPDELMRHVTTRLTDEGLVVELFATEDEPLFLGRDNQPSDLMIALIEMISDVFSVVENNIAIEGHSRTKPIVLLENPIWETTMDRAGRVRQIMESSGFDAVRLKRLIGNADREPITEDRMSVRNDRIEIILLRQGK
ncbi:flagellar motor protein MotB [Parasulfitobacter algicola]|uniref:Chemotaxis protein MotB n=1 Tax=Parasulfitobacter algicola TaxID=2614809 RepID=A0ABX2J1D7_9RHOB|nr:flagellar motor protein MotB [Sulfitobacter algicola]NSX56693.1 chemotaxis protein MotB [Sulfitobacter algicola]